MPPGRLLLVRHGESEGNRDRRFSIDNATPLTELGERQARTVGATIAREFRPTRMVASPYRRARHTAALIAEALGFTGTIAIEPDLHERSIGVLAGEPYRSTRDDARYDSERFWDWRPEGGESLEDVRIRAAAVIERLAAAHREEDVVVVSHGGVMLALCAHIEGSWRTAVAGNCELLVIEHDGKLPPAVGATFRCVVEDRDDAAAPLGLGSNDPSTESTG